jgi:hypothetical protein
MVRMLGAVVATALTVTCAVAGAATTQVNAVDRPGPAAKPGKPTVTLSVPTSVVEGDVLTIQARIGRLDGARRVELLRATGSVWDVIDTARVRKKRTFNFEDLAGTGDSVRYRVKLLLDKGSASSETSLVTIWHWTPMTDFETYYKSPGIAFTNNTRITLSGIKYRGGWEAEGDYGVWESRVSPGRHCSQLRGIAGLDDASSDGASAVVSVISDEATTVYVSPTLVPGTPVPFQVAIGTPFRLGVQAARTSLPIQKVYPAIASPELLCTGLGS